MSYRPLPALSALKPKYKGQQVVHGGRLNRSVVVLLPVVSDLSLGCGDHNPSDGTEGICFCV